MTQLRKMMLEELQRRNYSQTTVKGYLKIVESFAKHFIVLRINWGRNLWSCPQI